ncbi:MAG: DUF4397 domain-containing protein, partial [Chloroflexia bacterium]|nr:DUF4397 domain-containing protein [Chloroflexia bacterium]
DGTVVGGLDNVPYKGTATLELPAGVYDLIIATPDGATTLLDIPAFVLAAGDDITVFAVGDGVNQNVGLVALPRDGIVPPAEVRLAHLAPFAGGRAAVNVVVPTVPPLTLVSDFGFGDTTGFLRLPGGTYPINVVIPSMPASLADTVAISGSVTLAPGMRYTAMAIGGANGFAPELVLLNDPITPPITDTARVRIYHAAPFAPGDGANVSIRLQDGTVVPGLGNVPYKGTGTLALPPGTYDLIIATPDGTTTLLDLPPFTLVAGDDITVFAVGDGVNQDVGTVVLGLGEPERFRVYLPFVAN